MPAGWLFRFQRLCSTEFCRWSGRTISCSVIERSAVRVSIGRTCPAGFPEDL